jgi:hypothetical protein
MDRRVEVVAPIGGVRPPLGVTIDFCKSPTKMTVLERIVVTEPSKYYQRLKARAVSAAAKQRKLDEAYKAERADRAEKLAKAAEAENAAETVKAEKAEMEAKRIAQRKQAVVAFYARKRLDPIFMAGKTANSKLYRERKKMKAEMIESVQSNT